MDVTSLDPFVSSHVTPMTYRSSLQHLACLWPSMGSVGRAHLDDHANGASAVSVAVKITRAMAVGYIYPCRVRPPEHYS
jgi:hypothetical protein